MKLHEYQAKALFESFGIDLPKHGVVSSVNEARSVMAEIPADGWVVKAQVHAGARGKAGGIRVVNDGAELERAANDLLGSQLVTNQTGPLGLPVNQVLIEPALKIEQELYLSLLLDRKIERVVFILSTEGGMDIEEVAEKQPEKIYRLIIDPVVGLQSWQCRQVGFDLGLPTSLMTGLAKLMHSLYRLYSEKDASLIEINPLAVSDKGELVPLDAKVEIDDNALYRHHDIAEQRDGEQEDEKERAARVHDLNYISLDGDIACMVNGAGLAMATMDLIKLHGGEPANFLDVGGGTTAEKVAEAFKLIVSGDQVNAILINIFGGIVRCDLIAEGIISAIKEVGITIPVVVRLQGTNAEQARMMLDQSGLDLVATEALTNAAQQAVALAKQHNGDA
ncbi:MAG: ADP-forming succinate--CoA ligase subunit beta [Gammaproteobacteria bacterium]|nr:ADP-forming succinate--CoA ligase subunit beta [Gammaproteobacteria bacterium]